MICNPHNCASCNTTFMAEGMIMGSSIISYHALLRVLQLIEFAAVAVLHGFQDKKSHSWGLLVLAVPHGYQNWNSHSLQGTLSTPQLFQVADPPQLWDFWLQCTWCWSKIIVQITSCALHVMCKRGEAVTSGVYAQTKSIFRCLQIPS